MYTEIFEVVLALNQMSHFVQSLQSISIQESKQIKQRKNRLTPTQAVGVAVMTSLIMAAIVLVTALMFQPNEVFVLSQTSTSSGSKVTRVPSATSERPPAKGLNLGGCLIPLC